MNVKEIGGFLQKPDIQGCAVAKAFTAKTKKPLIKAGLIILETKEI